MTTGAGEGEGDVGQPAAAALGRLLGKEERVSDLLAFLAALDPLPLGSVLRLDLREPRVAREKMLRFRGQGRRGRPRGPAGV